MRALIAAAAVGVSLVAAGAVGVSAQSAVPRAADGKPDLTGVWQGGSTQRGNWEDANGGTGVGGTGRNPTAPVVLSSNDRPAGREGAPYQDWAAKKVLEAYNRRGIDDPAGHCLPGGVPRSVMLGLFPQQFVQTPKQLVILYEYMHTFRVIPIDAKHPDDLIPSYMGNSVAHWERDTLVVDVIGFNDKTWLVGHRHLPLGRAAHHGAVHPRRQGSDQLRGHDGGSEGADEAVDAHVEPHAA